MKLFQLSIAAALLLFPTCGWLLADQNRTSFSQSSNVQKSVTVTSDGKQTIKKTTITKNGETRTITEITDADGNTRIVKDSEENKSKEDSEPQKKSEIWLGLKPRIASNVLKGQLDLKENEGLVVEVIAPNGPAAKAGIQVNDLLLSLDKKPLGSPKELEAELQKKKAGEKGNFEVMRKGGRTTKEVTFENRPQRKENGLTENDPESGHTSGTFEEILSDPNIPESFKKTVREMQRRQREFMEKHKID